MARGPRFVGLRFGGPVADLPSAVRRASGRFSIVGKALLLEPTDSTPQIFTAVASGPVRNGSGRYLPSPRGTGVAEAGELARAIAITEAVERYVSLAEPPTGEVVRATFADVSDDAIAPARFARLSDAQYANLRHLRPLDETVTIDWCWAYSITRSKSVLVPAALVYFQLAARYPNNYIPELISTGFACHVDLSMAVLGGLCEVLERDALMVAWLNGLPFKRLVPEGTEIERLIHAALSDITGEVRLYALPTDSPLPVVLAVGLNPNGVPSAIVGAACKLTYEAAARKAIYEVIQMLGRQSHRDVRCPSDIRTLDDHADFYAAEGGAARFFEVVTEIGEASLATMPGGDDTGSLDQLWGVVSELNASGREVVFIDVTTPDVGHLGYRVVRVLVPGAVDMNIDGRYRPLGAERLREVPSKLGFRSAPERGSCFVRNPVPLA